MKYTRRSQRNSFVCLTKKLKQFDLYLTFSHLFLDGKYLSDRYYSSIIFVHNYQYKPGQCIIDVGLESSITLDMESYDFTELAFGVEKVDCFKLFYFL